MAENNSAEPADAPVEGKSADAPSSPEAPDPAQSSDVAAAEPAASGDGAPVEAAPKPKKKKKRRREKEETAPVRDPLGPDGRERPAFVLDYPSDPALDRLVKAFELGNYAFVREHAPELAEKASDARVRAAASELARRIEPDPLVKVLLAMSIALLVVLALWAYNTHGN
jgi:hypothetical protein